MAWSLSQLLASLHEDVEHRLRTVRGSIGHPTSKGDASERVWIELFNKYLPKRYRARKAYVVDSRGDFSDQLDVVVFDRQYSPLIFQYKKETVIAAESVYAVFEAKQAIDADHVAYAQKKVESVRRLHRTSLPIPHAGGVYPPKPPHPILGGILTFESTWSPPLGEPLLGALSAGKGDARIDIGCVAAHGYFVLDAKTGAYGVDDEGKHATAFLLRLISLLQASATVPMIDVQAYAAWLAD